MPSAASQASSVASLRSHHQQPQHHTVNGSPAGEPASPFAALLDSTRLPEQAEVPSPAAPVQASPKPPHKDRSPAIEASADRAEPTQNVKDAEVSPSAASTAANGEGAEQALDASLVDASLSDGNAAAQPDDIDAAVNAVIQAPQPQAAAGPITAPTIIAEANVIATIEPVEITAAAATNSPAEPAEVPAGRASASSAATPAAGAHSAENAASVSAPHNGDSAGAEADNARRGTPHPAATANGGTAAASESPPPHAGVGGSSGDKSKAQSLTSSETITSSADRASQGQAEVRLPTGTVHVSAAEPGNPIPVQTPGVPAGIHAATSAVANPAAELNAPAAVPIVGIAVEIVARTQAGKNRFEIRLDPPELGRIDVRLDVDRQGNVSSHLMVEHSHTLDLLRREAPQLERALQDAGLKTGDNGLQFSLRDQGFGAQNRNPQEDAALGAARIIVPNDDILPVETARGYGSLFGRAGSLDIRV